jgi:hypothetical protein
MGIERHPAVDVIKSGERDGGCTLKADNQIALRLTRQTSAFSIQAAL